MLEVKQHRSADCVVGGFRRVKEGSEVASILLGLYDDSGRLNHVGFTSGIAAADRTVAQPDRNFPGVLDQSPLSGVRARSATWRRAMSWTSGSWWPFRVLTRA